ncbi:hypothetical protein E4H12_05330 [Candidatus Thorarchaeota archaeon]|nr:MAG: hypothetical protein E4H12_05330 [Candidatus Thorarchaeota archaeon]
MTKELKENMISGSIMLAIIALVVGMIVSDIVVAIFGGLVIVVLLFALWRLLHSMMYEPDDNWSL